MQCSDTRALLSASLDGAIDSGERGAIDAHLRECPRCRSELELLRVLKHAIARLPSREEPPGAVRAHVEALRLGPRSPIGWPLLLAPALAAAAAALALMLPLRHQHGDKGATLADHLVWDHLSSVPEVRPAEIASANPQAILNFFSGHLPFPPTVPRVPGADLLGARLCQIEGRRVELIFYKRESRTLSLFITDGPVPAGECWEARAHHVCSRSMGALTFMVVAELPEQELRRLLEEATAAG